MLASSGSTRERLLIYGSYGTGKSKAVLDIAALLQATSTPSTIRILSTDDGPPRMLEGGYSSLSNVKVYDCVGFDDFDVIRRSAKSIADDSRPNDWAVIDMANHVWDAAQSYFSERAFGKSVDEYFLEMRAQLAAKQAANPKTKNENPFDGWKDWPVIKKLYNAVISDVMFGSKCNVIMICGEKKAMDDEDGDYQFVGQVPEGEKHLSHLVHTVIRFTRSKMGVYSMTTIKDREREQMQLLPISNFATQYLIGIAGWKV